VLTAIYLLAALLLILLNAFFVLAEFAMVKIRASRVEELIEQGDPRAELVKHVVEHLDDYLSLCQVGITFASIGLGFVGEPAIAGLIEPLLASFGELAGPVSHTISVTIAYIVVSYLHIVLGEMVPKSISIRATDAAALRSARPLRTFYVVFYLPLVVLNWTVNRILRLMGLSAHLPSDRHSEEELRIILDESERHGLMPFRRLLLMENVFDLGELKVRDAMRPRAFVKGLWAGASWEDNYRLIRESRLSRLPLMKDGMDKPIGIIHVKDLLYLGDGEAANVDLETLVRPYHQVSEDTPIENLLTELQRRRRHLAIVVDASDRWTGLITMEDVIEEIIGTVEDEFEVEPSILLADTLSAGRVVLGCEASTIEEAMRKTMSRIPSDELPISVDQILKLVANRAMTGVSFLGEGLAISHARVEGLDKSLLVFARSDQGIAIKGAAEKAHLVFVLLTPANQPRVQARLLSRIGRLLDSEYVEQRLREATSVQEVLEAIREGETAALG
jgi:CBS domain containing-hemolysin-like protein